MKQFISQFIPIILLFLILAYSNQVARFSHSILGKLVAISIIVFYTYQNKLLGLFTCTLFIFYYQSDSVENMLNINEEHVSKKDNPHSSKQIENIENYKESYKEHVNAIGFAQDEFRKENCKGNALKYKDMSVPTDMASHVFPELTFLDDFPCNPCNKSCNFSIIESKIDTEEKLVKPIFSADTM